MLSGSGGRSLHAAVLGFDVEVLARLGAHDNTSAAADELVTALANGWLALMRGQATSMESEMGGLFSRASAARNPAQVIEVTALRAMVALSGGKLAEAVAFARRASMMARTEALPASELLANLALARVRRHSGKPHLAVRILEALARFAPPLEAGWLDWECLLAGGTRPRPSPSSAPTRAAQVEEAGQGLLAAARAGDRARFERQAERLVQATAVFRDMQDEARTLVALLDPDRPAPETLLGFKRGEHDELQYGLFSAGVLSENEEPVITIFVVARPGQPGARILRAGLGLFGACRMLSCEDGGRRTHGRTDAGLAVLSLAGGDPVPEETFFRKVYGFAYSHAAHRGVLDVLVHRMRKRLGSGGAIARTNGHLLLELSEPIAVADPHCSPPAAARILSALAKQPRATADVIAGRLRITVRAAQIALQQLVADGACTVSWAGRHMEYQLQDTTFSEPTGTDVAVPAALPPSATRKKR